MYGVLIALVPTFIFSIVFFGLGAILVTLTSVVACLVFEYVIQKYLMKQRPTIWDGSAIITGVLLAFNLPRLFPCGSWSSGHWSPSVSAKMSFGGLGNNIFNQLSWVVFSC
ncbi:MAG: RnfABCDGE type electron transport complex subunit D [Butyricimonas faecihominis]